MTSVIELLCEEIPASMHRSAVTQITDFCDRHAGITYGHLHVFVSPRRLSLSFEDLALQTHHTFVKGPRLSAPSQAVEGFFKKYQNVQEENGYYVGIKTAEFKSIEDFLPFFIKELFASIKWPKDMRWPQSSLSWIRPVRQIFCSHDGAPLHFEVFDISSSPMICGHRFLAPQAFYPKNYEEDLLKAHVMISHEKRKEKILDDLNAQATEKGLSILWNQDLLEEVVGLVEYPFVAIGHIASEFMRLPREVLMTSMHFHQKYFALETKEGQLAPYFGVVLNCPPTPQILSGYERVLRARLKDAQFFYNHDVKIPLDSYSLENRIYHEKLGSVQQKVERLMRFVETPEAKRAARLCKADLKTMMVGEFPELQGLMGSIYAQEQGEPKSVTDLIAHHYNGLNELALADKIDALVGFFGVGIEPTGSKDPYALRRAALGILQILQNGSYPSPHALLQKAYEGYTYLHPDTVSRVEDFLRERLPSGIDLSKPLHESLKILENIRVFLQSKTGEEFIRLYKRVIGLLKHDLSSIEVCTAEPHDPLEKNIFQNLQRKLSLETLYQEDIDHFLTHYRIFSEDAIATARRMGLLKLYYERIIEIIHPDILAQSPQPTIAVL